MGDADEKKPATVAAIQLLLDERGEALESSLPGLLGRAKEKGAELALFPLLPAAETVSTPTTASAARTPAEFGRFWGGLARESGLFVGVGYGNVGYLFGPDGSVLLRQPQTHVTRREREEGVVPGTDLAVANLPFGRVGFAVGTDCWYPEVSRILALRGVDTVLAPVAVAAPYGFWQQAAGLWEEVQQNQVFGIEAGLAGNGRDGTRFAGRTAIMAPVEVTPGESGYLAHALGAPELMDEDHADGLADGLAPDPAESAGIIVTARIDPAMLEKARRIFPVFHFWNVPLYRRWFPDVYDLPGGGHGDR